MNNTPDNISVNHLDYSPDVLLEKKSGEVLLFKDIPVSKVGSNTYLGDSGLAVAAGNINEVQYNEGSGKLGASPKFTYSPNNGGNFFVQAGDNYYGNDLITNGGFAGDSIGWTLQTNWGYVNYNVEYTV